VIQESVTKQAEKRRSSAQRYANSHGSFAIDGARFSAKMLNNNLARRMRKIGEIANAITLSTVTPSGRLIESVGTASDVK
jgi:hypothetical protein